ncbi:MAG: ROK family protein [Brevinema sp.]
MSENKKHSTIALNKVFRIIKEHGPLYPKDIVTRSGFVKSTVSTYVTRLMELELIEEESLQNSLQKRKRIEVSRQHEVIAIYIGISSMHIALCCIDTTILEQKEFEINFNSMSPEDIVLIIINTIDEWHGVYDISGIGIGMPLIIEFNSQKCITTPCIDPKWQDFPISSILKDRYQCPIVLDNDANLLALGEKIKGEGKNVSNFIYIKLGTGIGAGIIIDNNIFYGALGGAGDIGHINIQQSEVPCVCGNKGCFEMHAGARGITQSAINQKSESDFLQQFTDEDISPIIVGRGFSQGDRVCTDIIINSGRTIGNILSNIVHILSPQLLIIGGGMSNIGYKLIATIKETLYSQAQPIIVQNLEIKQSKLLDKGGLIGAAYLISEYIFDERIKQSG